MTPFKAQGANQAISDAVLLADVLVDCIHKHGPEAGMDTAIPIFEQKMLSRSSRMVVGSREKAKEMHSSLALRPARKVQRETDVDMQEVIRLLKARGVGAHSATDPRGLDELVSKAMSAVSSGDDDTGNDLGLNIGGEGTTSGGGLHMKFADDDEDIGEEKEQPKKRKHEGKREKEQEKKKSKTGGNKMMARGDDGLWKKCTLIKTRKNGKHKVQLKQSGEIVVLEADCVKPR